MSRSANSIKVFSRFYRTIVLVFSLVILIALILATTRYFKELDSFVEQAEHSMKQRAFILNTQLEHSVKALTGLLEFADYCLKNPNKTENLQPDLIQDGKYFYLKNPPRNLAHQRKHLNGNITGIGRIDEFSLETKQELAMANSLNPAFVTVHHTNPEVTWFYYISKNRFVNLYPWVPRTVWKYSDLLISRDYFHHIQRITDNNAFYWSPPYEDSAGKGLTSSLAGRVMQNNQFVGAIILDINLSKLASFLPSSLHANEGYLLLDEKYNVLLHKSGENLKITAKTNWHNVLPKELQTLTATQLQSFKAYQQVGDWFIQKQVLAVNGWRLYHYQSHHQFVAPLSKEFLFWFVMLFSGLLAFILLIYWLTNRTFIKPAVEFIQHIENCSQGDSGKIKPTEDWRHWFHVVEDIFSQNRSLMQQLKDKNADLDKRVKEKTLDLLKTSEQHQRDYALLRSVMNAMQELIIFTDKHGKLIGCNLALSKFIGYKERSILGAEIFNLLPPVMGQALKTQAQQAYQDHQQQAYQQVVETSTHTFELFSRRFFNETGDVLGTINIFRDVTQTYEIQHALEKAKNQAEQANQAKDQFLANMSHEIRTPLNAIQGMMYLLAKTPLNRSQLQYLHNAEAASKSLLYLINELLDLAKIEAGKMPVIQSDIVLNEVVNKALKLNIAKAREKNLPVVVEIASDVPQVIYSDEMRLMQVFSNLLNNAIKFTHQGKVSLLINKHVVGEQAFIQVNVIDTGIGIAKNKQASLFKAFTQADESMTRKYGGSGLGLSICMQIVKLLGGEMQLTSDEGQGSTFTFSLPLSKQYADTVKYQQPCQITALLEPLSASLIDNIKHIGWQYYDINSFEELEHYTVTPQKVVIFNIEHLEILLAHHVQQLSQCALIALCVPMLSELDNDLNAKMEQFNVPWIIIEQPCYRIIIEQINEALLLEHSEEQALEVLENVNKPSKTLASLTILLVEDNLVNQMVAQELLQSMEATVVIANNGKEAIELLEKEVEQEAQKETEKETQTFDLVLMDIQMPVMDGLTAAKEIRKMPKYAKLPIIAMTAHAREEDQQQSLAAGMNLHIAKPVTYEHLLASIQQVILETK